MNANGGFTYTPVLDFNGIVTFTYRANDGNVDSSNVGTVTITVLPVNDAPVAVEDSFEIDENREYLLIVVDNDSDVSNFCLI